MSWGRACSELPPPLPPWPSYRQVRRFCRAVVLAGEVEPPLQMETLCATVGRLRGRQIAVHYKDLPPGVFGFSASSISKPVDFIFAARNTTRLHREHIVLHELGHVLAGHLDRAESTITSHSTDDDVSREREWVAESIAMVLAERALLYARRVGDRPLDPAARALDETLRAGGGWI